MSRVGRKPIDLPSGVKAVVAGGELTVHGQKDVLKLKLDHDIGVKVEGNRILVTRSSEEMNIVSKHGMIRALINNMVNGAVNKFQKELEIVGVGYRAEAKGNVVVFNLGYSHPIEFPVPKGIEIKTDKKGHVLILGADKQLVGEVAAEIRKLRPPEPYQGKGIKYVDEIIHRKVGKAAVGTGAA